MTSVDPVPALIKKKCKKLLESFLPIDPLYLPSLGVESSQSTDSNSSRGICELINSTLPGKRHPMWVGPGKWFPMWVGLGQGCLVNVIRCNRNDGDCRNGEDVAQNIRPEHCVQDITPCFAGIEVWLFEYTLTKAFFLTLKK